MRPRVGSMRDERGVVLPLALLVLLVLSAFLLAFLSLGGTEPQISRNLSEVTQARYVAEAGIEWAFDQLAVSTDWNVQLRGPDNVAGTADDGQLASATALAGLSAAFGTFSVTVRNDNQPNDGQITGQAVDSGDNTTDTNGIVIATATGTVNGVSRQIQVAVRRDSLTISGGVSVPGVGTNTAFSGNSFVISGNDTNVDGTAGTCAPVWGIGVADSATESAVEGSLESNQKDNVTGKKQDASGSAWGDNTIAPDSSLTPAQISNFVNTVKQKAQISLQSTGPSDLRYRNVGDSCAADWNSANCWGTRSQPKIVYVKGDLDPTDSFKALKIDGNSTGAGILIVEDGDLKIEGTFRWEGLIIVTGKYVGLRYEGGGNQKIYGAVVVNEEVSAGDPNREIDVGGNAEVYYSCQALNNVWTTTRSLYSLRSWREL